MCPAQILMTSGDDFHDQAKNADLIIVVFSRREVEAGLIGDALTRLLVLSDSSEFVAKFKDRMMFKFDGYDEDPRELFEVLECRNFLRTLNAHWPFWFHFLEKENDSFAVLFRLLCDVDVIRMQSGQVGFRFKDQERMRQIALSLFVGVNALYAAHDIGDEESEAMSERVVKAFNKVIGL